MVGQHPNAVVAAGPRIFSRKVVSVLGATGSIGRGVADIIEAHPDRFSVDAVVGGQDVAALAGMAKRLKARFAAIGDADRYQELKAALAGSQIECGAGDQAVIEAAAREHADIVVAAIVGAAGLRPTWTAMQRGATIALANKECLVSAGDLFMAEAVRQSAPVLPVDSEHSAVFQALDGSPLTRIREVTLTASGGPFRTWDKAALARVRPEQALRHPTWSMGAKITIDSATLMNKGLELIEAHHLFGLPPDKLGVVVQPQSIVHAFVAYTDGAVMAHMGMPDMRAPIAYALGYPERIETPVASLDLVGLGALQFEAPDRDRFPALDLAMAAMRAGGAAMTVFNAANEIAVEAFLAHRLGFLDISMLVSSVLDRHIGDGNLRLSSLDDVLAVDAEARKRALEWLAQTR